MSPDATCYRWCSQHVALPVAEPAEETQCHGKNTELGVRTLKGESNFSLWLFCATLGKSLNCVYPTFPLGQLPSAPGGMIPPALVWPWSPQGWNEANQPRASKVPSLMSYSRVPSPTLLPMMAQGDPPPLLCADINTFLAVTVFYCNIVHKSASATQW